MLNNLENQLSGQYEQTENLQDLEPEAAVLRAEAALGATPEDHRARTYNAERHYSKLVDRTGNLQDLTAAITRAQAAVEATPEDHPDRARMCSNLGMHYSKRYDRTRNLQDLEVAIARGEAAVQATPEDDPSKAGRLNYLGLYFGSKYNRTGNLQALEAAIAHLEAAVEATPENDVDRGSRLNNLGIHFGSRYRRTGSLQDLEDAIARGEAAVQVTPEDHPDRAGMHSNLGLFFSNRYERTGNLQDLDTAITQTEIALQATPEDHPDRATMLNNLGINFSSRYQLTGNLQDLEAAIAQAKAALGATPDAHGGLNNLGLHYSKRYHRTGNLQDLEAAIAHLEAAVKASPEDHPHRAGMYSNLGLFLSSRYERTGNLQDLEAAIAQAEAAVEATPEDHPDRARKLSSLGQHFSSRYERTGNLQDLEVAIAQAEAAVNAIQIDHPARTWMLNNLGNLFFKRYERIGNLQDLEAAIAEAQAAVEATSLDHVDQARRLNNLGLYLGSQYDRTGNLQDLEAAIAQAEAAVEATPEDHPDRGIMLNNLGINFCKRYQRTRNLQDLETAIAKARAALEETPEDHPNRAAMLSNLGNRFILYSGAVEDSALSIQVAKLSFAALFGSWLSSNSPMLIRLEAALTASTMLVFSPLVEDLSMAYLLLHDAIHLMPLAASRSLAREDQQHILGRLNGLASFAAAVSLQAGQSPLEALRLLELGRSVTNGQLLDYRSDISDLTKQYPALATAFDSLRLQLDSSLSFTESSDYKINKPLQMQQAAIRKRNQVTKDLDTTLQQIRQKPGFENFLRPETEKYFLSAAQDGPIVVLNVTKLRSDAILITSQKVTSIGLPHLSHDLVNQHFGTRAALVGSENQSTRKLLAWLWKAAVQPVLEELGFFQKKTLSTFQDSLPRIWWIGVGLMANAPLHAAGEYNKSSRPRLKMSTLEYCISSYTSTIRALLYSRSRQHELNPSIGNLLIVTMPTTPGAGQLDGVENEADEIKQGLEDSGVARTVQILKQPTAEHVLQLLPNYSIVHFACHGLSTPNPADSHLLLLKQSISHDGTHAEEVDKLRVKDIAALNLSAARLAYLSACSTADSTNPKLTDEVTHIVSSFHIAGFAHVIGTLWPAEDEACKVMAADFYSSLGTTDNVATAYHNAILKLRASKPSQPLYWAPFIHFGA